MSTTRTLEPTNLEQAKEVVYSYIAELAQLNDAERARTAFYALMMQRIAVGRQDVIKALNRVLESEDFTQEAGLKFINRCYYTICNPWHLNSDRAAELQQLIDDLRTLKAANATAHLTRPLQRRMHDFRASEYTECLCRQMRLGGHTSFSEETRQYRGIVADYLPDYFYLYKSTTCMPDIEDLEQQMAHQRQFESGLAQKQQRKLKQDYTAVREYYTRRKQGVAAAELVNPTRLPIDELEQGLRDYHPRRVDGLYARSQQLEASTSPDLSFQAYRPKVQAYLMQSVETLPEKVQGRFRRELHGALESAVQGDQRMAGSTVIVLFTRLLDAVFLPDQSPLSVEKFCQSLESASPSGITRVLLSLVLSCPMIRFHLEKKLGYLYRQFEQSRLELVSWLVKFFEHINLGLVMNAKKLHYPSLKQSDYLMDSI